MASSSLALLALVVLLGHVQCQSDEDGAVWDREFDFDRDRLDRERVDRDREFERDQTADGCYDKVMDIFFVLDSSTSIWINDYRQEHQFVRDIVTRLDVSSRNTRVGILTFSDDIERPPLSLGRYQTKSDILASITEQNLRYRTGVTNTDQAIRYVRENSEFRQDITKVIVVVTDGGSRSPGATAREAELAREQGFYLFVVGVGQYLNEREWNAIASDPDDSFIYNITNFRYLDTVKYSLPSRACALPPIIVGGSCSVDRNADVYFVAGPGGTERAIQLIDNFVDRTTDDNNLLRLSYMMGVCNNAENVRLGDISQYCDRFGVVPEADADTYKNLMNRMRQSARQNRQTRTANQVAVLFIDEESMRLNRFDIVNEARSAMQNDGIELIVVDLGVRYSSNLQNMLSNRNNFIRFTGGSISGQGSVQMRLIDQTCDAINDSGFDFGVEPNK